MNRELEKRTLIRMFHIYCKAFHKLKDGLCSDCDELQKYSLKKLAHCRFGDDKPACKLCPVHCFNPGKREQVKVIMRFSGPRMMYHSPFLAIRHLIHNKISKKTQGRIKREEKTRTKPQIERSKSQGVRLNFKKKTSLYCLNKGLRGGGANLCAINILRSR